MIGDRYRTGPGEPGPIRSPRTPVSQAEQTVRSIYWDASTVLRGGMDSGRALDLIRRDLADHDGWISE